MGKLVELLGTIVAVYFVLRWGWPWPILFVIVYIVLLNLKIVALGRTSMISRRLGTAGGVVLFVTLVLTALLRFRWRTVALADAGLNPLSGILGTALRTDLLFTYVAFLVSGLFTLMITVIFLVAYGTWDAKRRYGMYPQYPGHEHEALISSINILLGLSNGIWSVDQGVATVVDKPNGPLALFGGPGILIVSLGHAVILQRAGRLTRIVGSGLTFLEAFERIDMIVQLQTRREEVVVKKVVTKDGVIIDEIVLHVFHKVDPGSQDARVHDGIFEYNRAILFQKVWSPSRGDWQNAVRAISETVARNVIGRYKLEKIILPLSDEHATPLRDILAQEINRATTGALGVRIVFVNVGAIHIPEEVEKQLLEGWRVEQERTIRTTRADTEKVVQETHGAARLSTIMKLVSGLEALAKIDASAQDLVALRFIEYLEEQLGQLAVSGSEDLNTLIKLQSVEALRSLKSPRNGHDDTN